MTGPFVAEPEGGVPASREVDAGRLLDEAAWRPFQKGVLLLVCCVILLDGIDTQTLTLALPAITREWGIGRATFAPVLAASFVAMAGGTAIGGVIGDRAGRRAALIGSTLVFGLGTLLGAWCDGVLSLAATRIAASIGLGAAMPNATAMVAEFTPRRQRTLGLSIAMSSVPLGGFVGGLIAAQVLPLHGWRTLFVISGAIPLLGVMLIAVLMPESVRYLIARRLRPETVAALLAKLGHAPAAGDVFVDRADRRAERGALADLFGREYRRDTLSLAIAFFCAIFATLALTSWLPSLLADAGYGLAVASTGTAMYSIGALFGALVGALLFGWVGSRAALLAMGVGALACCVALALVQLGPGLGRGAVFAAFFATGIFIPGGQVLLFSLAGQVFPTSIRATGVGFVAAVGRLGAVGAALLGPLMLAHGNRSLFTSVALVVLAGGAAVQLARTHLGRSGSAGRERQSLPRTTRVSSDLS